MRVDFRSVYPDDDQDQLRLGVTVSIDELNLISKALLELTDNVPEGAAYDVAELAMLWTKMHNDFYSYLQAAEAAMEGAGEELEP